MSALHLLIEGSIDSFIWHVIFFSPSLSIRCFATQSIMHYYGRKLPAHHTAHAHVSHPSLSLSVIISLRVFQLFKTIFQGGRVHVDLLKQIQPKERRVGGCGGALITLTLNFLFPQCKFSHTLQSKPGTKRSRLPSLCYFTSLWVCIVW